MLGKVVMSQMFSLAQVTNPFVSGNIISSETQIAKADKTNTPNVIPIIEIHFLLLLFLFP